jgi:ubiquitin-associated SH3 domain-containing protein
MVSVAASILMRELIVYACPTGELARQLDAFYDMSRAECGPNTAHRYMPHCTLTGFFHDEFSAIPTYLMALDQALAQAQLARPSDAIRISGMRFLDNFYFLAVESAWLQQLAAGFAQRAVSSTRPDAVRLKDQLHVSLAYGFAPEHGQCLTQLARQMVDASAPVGWELRFYERHTGDRWTLHKAWTLG